tara:strand:+ start:2056 stop:2958 length:903 start_codon:yes stop_codon:yes gene_type:complete
MTWQEKWLRQPQTFWFRRVVFQIHLWSGLAIGLYIVAISISGSILVYRSELRQAYEPEPRFVSISGERLTEEELTHHATQAYPQHQVARIILRDDPARAATVTLTRNGSPTQLLFDPYSGADLGHRLPLPYRLTTWLLDLHDNLLYGEIGRRINGLGAIILTLLAGSGVVIWWPGVLTWRRSLQVSWRATWNRFNWTLHSALGAWFVLFVAMWGITGIYLTIPEPFNLVADTIEPVDEETFEPRTVDTILYWIASVHFGRFGGITTKIIWFIVGVIPVILFLTGTLMWWNRVIRPRLRIH